MFHRSSFKTASFKPASWRFPDEAPTADETGASSGGAGWRRRTGAGTGFTDDDLIEFAVHLIISGALNG